MLLLANENKPKFRTRPKPDLKEGDEYEMTATFKNAGHVPVKVLVTNEQVDMTVDHTVIDY